MSIKCRNCGAENSDNAGFCVCCGQQLYEGGVLQSALRLGGFFVSEDEYVIATLNNGIVNNVISGEGLRREKAVLTNKRLYYNYKDGIINKISRKEKVDVKDITGTKIEEDNPRGWLIAAIILVVTAFVVTLYNLLWALFCLIIWLIRKKHVLIAEYAGGEIRFSVKGYKMQNVLDFQRSIHALKDGME